jgi:hypothetical protein
MTADDLIFSFTRIMDGSKGYPGARYVRLIKGAVDVEKGTGQGNLRPQEDRRFTLEMTITDRVDPGLLLLRRFDRDPAQGRGREGQLASNPVGLGPFKFKEHIPGSRVVAERFDKFYKTGKPYLDKLEVLIMAEAAARDVAFRNKEIDTSILGPAQYVAYRADPQLSKGILEVAEMFTRSMHMNRLDQAVPGQAGASGLQLRHRFQPDHLAPGQGQGLSRHELAAALVCRLRQDDEAVSLRSRRRPRSCWPRRASPTASSSNGRPARTRAGACRSSRR